MKRFLSIALVLVLMLTSLPVLAEPAVLLEPAAPISTLPAVGDVLYGFEATELGTIDLIGASTVLFTHQKTGAQLLYVASDDINRSFDITFRTPALDERGEPHVFEHATLSGSERYPYQNIVYSLMSKAYSTFVNASTYTNFTTFPVASLSEDQLFVMTDIYMDAVFHPAILEDERIYRREAWRYELQDKDDPLTITGTVYSEMKGATTLNRAALLNLSKTLYPNSLLSNDSGGNPADIPELTHQQLIDYHDAYYHPSNALIILYGQLDYAKFLEHMDKEYLSKFDKKEFDIDWQKPAALTEPVEKVFEFPVEQGSPENNASRIYYGFRLNELSMQERVGLELLSSALNHESSPFMQAARAKMPGKEVYAGIDTSTNDPIFYFAAIDVNQSDMELFQSIADESLTTLIKDGVDLEAIDAILAANRFSQLTIPENQNLGVGISPSIAMHWVNTGETNFFNEYLTTLDEMGDIVGGGYLEKLADEHLVNNVQRALACTSPVPGLAEKQAEELAATLAEKKAAMADEEIEALVNSGKELTAWSAEEIPQSLAKQIQVLTVQSLPEEVEHYEIKDEIKDGVRYLKTQTNASGINSTTLMLDVAGFPMEQLHDLNMYTSLLTALGTGQYTREQLETLIIRYLNGFSVGVGQYEDESDEKHPVLQIGWMGLGGEYQTDLALVEEILFQTQFDDVQIMKGLVGRMMTGMKTSIAQVPYNLQMQRAAAALDENAAYSNYMGGLDFYQYLKDIAELLETNPAEFTDRMQAVQIQLKDKHNAIAIYTGNEAELNEIDEHIGGFFDRLPADGTVTPIDLSTLPRPSTREALIVDSAVQYNLLFAKSKQLGLEYTAKLLPITAYLDDNFFMPKLRHAIGAYGCLTSIGEENIIIDSYRDPSIAQTFAAYEELPEFLKNTPLTQDQLDAYIISSYSGYALPKGALTGAIAALSLRLKGESEQDTLRRMREIKQTTPQDVAALSETFAKLLKDGVKSTVGGASMINDHKDLYDEIIDVNSIIS